jgi:hypothetical protein
MSGRRTIYESAAGRRRRRPRAAKVTALVAVLALAALALAASFVLRDGSGDAGGSVASAAPSEAPSPAPVARLADVEVHQGETATILYRIVAAAGTTAVTLVVRDAGGQQVKARRLTDAAEPGKRLEATVPIDLEPGRYTYELRLGDEDAASASPSAGAAQASDGTASAALVVRQPLPPGFPGARAVTAAKEWISGRDGDGAFAVVDTNGEDAGGYRQRERFQLASLSKAILLVASLRADPTPDAATEATLARMITESDNGAADAVFAQVGARGMRAVAKAAGMQDYEQGSGWIDTRDSARDQARFFWRLESLVPPKGRALARELLSEVIPIQRWGIPAAAGPEGWASFFKGGWLGLDNKLMTQAAWLEKGKKRWALAVMSDNNPTRSYGWDTEKGVTGLLLGQAPTPAYLAVVLE